MFDTTLQISAKVVGSPHPVRAKVSVAVMTEKNDFCFHIFPFCKS